MAVKRNQHEMLARLSVVLAAVGVLLFVLITAAILQNLRLETLEVPYNPQGMRFYAIIGAVGLTGIATGVGFFAGLASAGHKRNKLSHLSWAGFFLNAGIATLTLCAFAFFWFAKESTR